MRRRKVTEQDFVGAKMANFLFAMSQLDIGIHYRQQARELYEKWDRIATFRLSNPIVASQLEARFAAERTEGKEEA